MPFLFWATLPFAMIDMWFRECERARSIGEMTVFDGDRFRARRHGTATRRSRIKS